MSQLLKRKRNNDLIKKAKTDVFKLTNSCSSTTTRCNECSTKLVGSTWKNRVVFYSFSEEVSDGFLCVMCILEPTSYFSKPPITEEELNEFVKKSFDEYPVYDPSPLKINRRQLIESRRKHPKYLSTECQTGFNIDHRKCKNYDFQCTCKCHTKERITKKLFIFSNDYLRPNNTKLNSCFVCGIRFKVGDSVSSLRRARREKRYHTKCFEEDS